MPYSQSLSPSQARRLALLSQGIYSEKQLGRGESATLKAIEKLGYIQIDTISVVERAHHHTLWNRIDNYQPAQLASLQDQGKIFEYWSHAAAYLPMRDYRFTLPRKNAIANGEKHWYEKDHQLCKTLLERIRLDGPLRAKDLADKTSIKSRSGWWDWKPAKRQLEQLFMEGEIMIAKREGFQKVYDLSEQVLPSGIDTSRPSQSEYHQHLIERYLSANGIGTAAEISYLRKGLKAPIQVRCLQMLEEGQLVQVSVGQQAYFTLPDVDSLLAKKISRKRVKILSPFDNLVIQRKRLCELFDFDYQIECYVPAAKRRYGYFSLPILWGQDFVGRMDAKIDRKSLVLTILNLQLKTDDMESFLPVLKSALKQFLNFNRGKSIAITRISSSQTISKTMQQALIGQLT